jgi:hypothetical protein
MFDVATPASCWPYALTPEPITPSAAAALPSVKTELAAVVVAAAAAAVDKPAPAIRLEDAAALAVAAPAAAVDAVDAPIAEMVGIEIEPIYWSPESSISTYMR